MIIDTIFW